MLEIDSDLKSRSWNVFNVFRGLMKEEGVYTLAER